MLRSLHTSKRFFHATQRYASTLVIANHNNEKIDNSTLSAITAGQQLGGDVAVLVAGQGCAAAAAAASQVSGVSKVLHADHAAFANRLPENFASFVEKTVKDGAFTHVLSGANAEGKNLLPRLSALLDSQQISEITQVVDENTFVRPIYAGNALATVKSSDSVKVLTVRGTAFDKATTEGGSAAVEEVAVEAQEGATKWEGVELTKSERPELTAADIVVAGGRALKSSENFSILESLSDKLGAGLGASRAAVDAGYCPNDMQIGQTGKIIAPQLYIGVGISGAIQHLAGMSDSKTIVVINKDPEAPFFQRADFGLVADLFTAVPELESKLAK